jgi:hypothetical protein
MSRMTLPNRKTLLVTAASIMTLAGVSAAYAAAPGAERAAERAGDRCERMTERLAAVDKDLTPEQVRDILAGKLAERDNANIKIGKVTPKGEDVVSVEILTTSGALVNVRDFSTKTGMPVRKAIDCEKVKEAAAKRAETVGEQPRRERRFGDRFRGQRGEHARGGHFGGDRLGGMALISAGPDRDLNLTVDEVRTLSNAFLIMTGNERLKVGQITEKNADTYTVNIVTADNALVFARDVDRHTGRPTRNED